MAPRPNWKGYLKLSLVSCSVALYSATTTSERIRFNILNKKTGNRVRNLVIDSETEEPVEQEDRVKGYQFEKGQYIQVEDDELDEVALESTHTIDIESFVPREEVDEIYLDESYYIVPDRQGRLRGLRSDPRRDGEGRPGRSRPRGAVPPRTHSHAAAARQGIDGDGAALQQRGPRRGDSYFDEIPYGEGPGDMLDLATAYPQEQEGEVRSRQVRGPLRDRAAGADPGEAGR